MNILQKAEALAAKVGKSIDDVWAEFEAFVEGKKEAAKALPEAPETVAGASADAGASTVAGGAGDATVAGGAAA